jgi:hypothetical protein
MRHSDTLRLRGTVLGRDLYGNSIYQASGIRSPLPEQFAGTFLREGPSGVLRVAKLAFHILRLHSVPI